MFWEILVISGHVNLLGDCGAGEYFILSLALSILIGTAIYLINNKYLNYVFI